MNNTATPTSAPDLVNMVRSPGGRILAAILSSLSSRIRYAS